MTATNYDPTDPLARFGRYVLSHVQLSVVFWGPQWSDLQASVNSIKTGVQAMCNSGYLSGLDQYNDGKSIHMEPVNFVDDPRMSPPTQFSDPADSTQPMSPSDVVTEITSLLDQGKVKLPEDTGCALLCMVLMPPGVTFGKRKGETQLFGQHFYFDYVRKKRRVYYGWVLNASEDKIMVGLSEELVEAITDPIPPTGWVVLDSTGTNRELCDVCEGVTHYVTGEVAGNAERVLVKAYYSLKDGDAIGIETGSGAHAD